MRRPMQSWRWLTFGWEIPTKTALLRGRLCRRQGRPSQKRYDSIPMLVRAHMAKALIALGTEWNWSGAEDQYRIALEAESQLC